MRILYVAPAYKPAYRMGGPIASVAATAETLARKGHDVTVATTNANLDADIDVALSRPVDVDGVTVWYFQRQEPLRKWLPFIAYLSQSMGFAYAPEMKAALRLLIAGADVVHTQMPFVYPTYVASRLALRSGKPFFYQQRGNFLASHVQRRALKKRIYIELFEKPVLRRASGLIALSNAEKEAFHRLAPDAPSVIIPNGVTVPARDDGAAARVHARWGVPEEAIVLLFFSRLEPWKGADEILAAFDRVQSESPDVFLVMAGDDHCGVETRWRPVSERAGYARRLVFTGGLTGPEKEDMLHRADLFSLPSRGEGLSMAMLEAMAHGTAVMLSPECNFPDAERIGAGVTVKRDVETMAAALKTLLSEPERLRAMGDAGRALMIQEYSWDVVTDRLIDVYRAAIRA
ncbi:MAG TPA: glycosyltransferase [Thermoanaerobaculia bacterium]|jgi:glycosyltransferase involved in cell wall biosynthesis|nr:glycosyltransferase [Thermoanaerobaculia bacterium]